MANSSSKNSLWLIVLLIVSIVGTIGATFYAFSQSAVIVAEDFVSLLKAKKISQAYSQTDRRFQSYTKEKEFANVMLELQIDHIKDVRYSFRSRGLKWCRVNVYMDLQSGKKLHLRFRLLRNGMKWKIYQIRERGTWYRRAIRKGLLRGTYWRAGLHTSKNIKVKGQLKGK